MYGGLNAQNAVHNYGNIQVHGDAMVGFHMDVINDGTFDQNMGLVGFYNENAAITLSGAFPPIFYDTEIAVDNGLFIETPIAVINNSNFISGNIFTPRDKTDIHIKYMEDAFYTGESSTSKVNGYSLIEKEQSFTFPIGDDNRLRPLTITSTGINTLAKGAYFYEDPNAPSTFQNSFNTDIMGNGIFSVSYEEFWRLEGSVPSKVTLTWDERSNVGVLGEVLRDLKVVGWSKEEQQWVNLGNTNVRGEMIRGEITSDLFIPNDYEILTIGGNEDIYETYSVKELDNYYLTPNGDGKNDFLVIDGMETSPNNTLEIFDRNGLLVYYKANYTNEFNGMANTKRVVKRGDGLPSGIYFYLATLKDTQKKHQGYLYINP
ncbi:gliding motility-associated C-terminal domain-containing protein [Sediminicola sp. 1XM1-17]|uniref:gliding motility-associated C-terminal domain-containing protein n=1 Tax=Sediminicola sp. 1XM1-17 TaxID=3127702 RepID=UPI0030782BA8